MKRMRCIGVGGGMLVCGMLLLPEPAHAYLDPGTGSYIFQLLLAGLFGAAFAIKLFWAKIKAFVTGAASGKRRTPHGRGHED